jgi:hypothetical protein
VLDDESLLAFTQESLPRISTILLKAQDSLAYHIKQLRYIISPTGSFQSILDLTLKSKSLIFILLGVLPCSAIDSMYQLLAKTCPDDLSISTVDGMRHARVFFETPSLSIDGAMEKIKAHFNLMFFSNIPKIKEEFFTHAQIMMTEALQKPDHRKAIQKEISTFIETQIQPRLDLYQLILRPLNALQD